MKTRKRLPALALCAAAALVGLSNIPVARAARAHAGDGSVRQVNATAPVSLADGQTLRVNFFNAGRSPFEIIPCIFDGDGAHLKTGAPVQLAPGQTLSFEMSRAEAFMRDETRLVVRGAAHVRSADRKSLLVTGEVVEAATGRSSLFVSPAARVGFDPQPDPPATR